MSGRVVDKSATERNTAILHEYEGGSAMQQIGDKYHVSRERIRQIVCAGKPMRDRQREQREMYLTYIKDFLEITGEQIANENTEGLPPRHHPEPCRWNWDYVEAQRAKADMRRRGTMTTPVRPQLRCKRCGQTWFPRTTQPPKQCPECKSSYWNRDIPPRTRRKPRRKIPADPYTTAAKLIQTVEARGGLIQMIGPKVSITPSTAATMKLREALIAHKKEIVALLREPAVAPIAKQVLQINTEAGNEA